MSAPPGTAPPAIADFEDFEIGQRFAGGERVVTAADLAGFAALSGDRHPLHADDAYARRAGFGAALVHGPFGLAGFFGWFHELGIARDSVIALLDTNWRYLAPVLVGDRIGYEMTITSCRLSSRGDRGVVGRHVRVLRQDGVLAQEGSTAVLVRARGDAGYVRERELFGHAWAGGLAARLNASAAFGDATRTWDGTVAVGNGDRDAQFRIYQGRVIAAGPRTPHGPTFTLEAGELTWAELIAGPENDMMKRAMRGAFTIRGDAYEYLRLTKALNILVDCARAQHRGTLP